MAKVDRLKKRLVRELVQENVALKTGQAATVRRQHRRWRALRLGFALSLLPLGAIASAVALTQTSVPGISQAALPADRDQTTVVDVAAARAAQARRQDELLADWSSRTATSSPEAVDPQIFPLAIRRIVVDAGHGGEHPGAATPSGLLEKEITLDVGNRLAALLERAGFEVLTTRDKDQTVPLEDRARLANEAGADAFVSIHVNWIADRSVRGVETYYLGPTDDPYLTQLAAQENQDSGYAMADLRRLLDRIYSGVRESQSRRFAEDVQAAMFRSLQKLNPGLTDRGVKSAPFLVLVDTEMPAILAEVSCLSNEREAELLTKPLYRQYIAEALAQGILAYAGAHGEFGEPGQETGQIALHNTGADP